MRPASITTVQPVQDSKRNPLESPVVGDVSADPVQQPPTQSSTVEERCFRSIGLHHNPFPVVPAATSFYLSAFNEAIIEEVIHSVQARKGFIVITGEVGLGKSTLSRRILMELEKCGVQTALIFNTFNQGAELLSEINRDFGICEESERLQVQMAALNEFLLKNLELGVNCAIVIDDAQQLSLESLELIRQVSNLETTKEKLVQILLVGQPELNEKLNTHELRQLESRIVLKHIVSPFDLKETKQYVQFKLAHAGNHGRLRVTSAGFRLLQRVTGGNPRRINILLDRCLYGVIACESDRIDRRILTLAVQELRKQPQADTAPKKRWLPKLAQSSLLALLIIFLMFGVYGLSKQPQEWRPVGDYAKATVKKLFAAPIAYFGNSAVANKLPPSSLTGDIREPITALLSAYNLEQFLPEFLAALATGETEEVVEEITATTGLRLVQFSVLPDGVAEENAVFNVGGFGGKADNFVLFWQPVLWNKAQLSYRFRQDSVIELQRPLQQLGYYHGNLDGLAGPLTVDAIRRFQSAVNITPSGYPGIPTLFMLENLSQAAVL